MHFADKLFQKIQKTSPISVGIDPRINMIPEYIQDNMLEKYGDTVQAVTESFYEFSIKIIDAVHELVPAVKLQIAFFEMYGFLGIEVFEKICSYAEQKGLIVISDAKRNDIGSTAEAYAQSFLGTPHLIQSKKEALSVDALTVTPYLGSDGIRPFTKLCDENDKGIFILVKTSNPSSHEIQDLPTGDHMCHEEVAQLVSSWGMPHLGECHFSSVGAVVGATYPEEAAYLRSLMPNQFFLVPGYGAQGGDHTTVKPCFNADGHGAIVNSSRAILYAYKNNQKYSDKNFAEAARDEVLRMKKDLSQVV
jgi:orotidine-5'-phosphate decarboxylase